MENAGFIDRLGRENVCPHITAALARSREILGLPPVDEPPEPHETLHSERQAVEAARKELAESLARAERILSRLDRPTQDPPARHP
jgi:SulP family sulfate permease